MRSWQRWLEQEPGKSKAETIEERLAELEAENEALRKALRSALKELITSGALTKGFNPTRVACARCLLWFPKASLDATSHCRQCREVMAQLANPSPPPRPTGVLRVLCKKCQTLSLAADLDEGECRACRRVDEGRYR